MWSVKYDPDSHKLVNYGSSKHSVTLFLKPTGLGFVFAAEVNRTVLLLNILKKGCKS